MANYLGLSVGVKLDPNTKAAFNTLQAGFASLAASLQTSNAALLKLGKDGVSKALSGAADMAGEAGKSLDGLNKALKDSGTKTKAAAKDVDFYAKAQKDASLRSKNFQKALEEQARVLGKSSLAFKQQTAVMRTADDAQRKAALTAYNAGKITKQAMLDRVAGFNKFTGASTRAGRASQAFGRAIASVGAKLKAFAAYAVAAVSIASLVKAFKSATTTIADHDQALKDLQAITGATVDEVKELDETMRRVGATTKFSAVEVAGGLKLLGQAGFSASESIQTIQAVSDLATGTLSTMATATELVTTALRVFKIDAEDSQHVADVFTNAVNNSKLSIDKLKIALNYVGPIAARAGLSIEGTTTALAMLANSGQRASSMSTGLRRVIKELVSPSKKMADAIRAAGYAVDDLNPQVVGFRAALSRLPHIVKDASDAFYLFGQRGSTAASALAEMGAEGYDALALAISKTGTAARNASIQMQGIAVSWKNLQDKIKNLVLALGDAGLTAVLRRTVNGFRHLVDAITAVAKNPLTPWLVGLTAAFVLVGSVTAIYAGMTLPLLTTALGFATTAALTAAAAIETMTIAMNMNPWVAAFTAVALVVAFLVAKFVIFNDTIDDTIRQQARLQSDAEKTISSLDNLTKSLEKATEGSKKHQRVVDGLIKAYPEYALEIKKVSDEKEKLLKIMKWLRAIEDSKRVKAQIDEAENLAIAISRLSDADESRAKKVERLTKLLNTLDEAGRKNDVNSILRVRNKTKGEREFLASMKMQVLAARDIRFEDAKAAQAAVEKIKVTKKLHQAETELQQTIMDKAKKALVAATAAVAKTQEKVDAARRYQDAVESTNGSLIQQTKATNDTTAAEKEHQAALDEVIRLNSKIVVASENKQKALVKESELAVEVAEIEGNRLKQKLAAEKVVFTKQLESINKIYNERIKSGVSELKALAEKTKLIELAEQSSADKIVQINKDNTDNILRIKERAEQALEPLRLQSAVNVKEALQAELQARVDKNKSELQMAQAHLKAMQKLSTTNPAEVAKAIKQIETLKKKATKDEIKLIAVTKAAVNERYELEKSLIAEAEQQALDSLELRNAKGSLSDEEYAGKKAQREAHYADMELNAARAHEQKVLSLKHLSDADRQKAHKEVLTAEHKRHQIKIDNIKAEREAEIKAAAEKADAEAAYADRKAAAFERTKAAVAGLYDSMNKAALGVSAKMYAAIHPAEQIAGALGDAATETEKLKAQVAGLEKNFMSSLRVVGPFAGLLRYLGDQARKISYGVKEQLQLQVDMNKTLATTVDETTNLGVVQTRLNRLRSDYEYLGEKDLENLRKAKARLQDQINAQRKLNAEKKDTVTASAIQAKLDAAQAAGVDISNYDFAPKDKEQLEALEKANAILDEKIKKQKYADFLAMQELKKRGATQEEIDRAEADAQDRLDLLSTKQEGIDLERDAITASLDLEVMNLQIINDLKIAQYEQELLRAEEAHKIRMAQIDAENVKYSERFSSGAANGLMSRSAPGVEDGGTRYARGGRIPGESAIDSVPVLARPGEWFIRNESARHWTDKFGRGFMNGINKPMSDAGRSIASAMQGGARMPLASVPAAPRLTFASGGEVPSTDSLLQKLDTLINKQGGEKGRTVTIKLENGRSSAKGQFAENDAKVFLGMVKQSQLTTR